MNYLMVALGGICGSLARYLVADFVSKINDTIFPYGTLVVNVTGAFILGLLGTLFVEKLAIDPNWRIMITTGLLGSFTTFSTLEFETLKLWQDGMVSFALLNALGSIAAGFAAVWLGFVVAQYLA